MDTPTVENLCNLLGRSRLVSAEEVPVLRERWFREAGETAADAAKFRKWLVVNQYLTDYQAGLLLRGHADRFFLNEYKLLDRIGVGRMAGVYKAVHRLGPIVAIKVLPPSKAKDANTFARFQREGRLALRLKHPNVVRTFQIAEDKGLHYLVMEYLEGETLEEVLKRRGKLPTPEAVRLIHQALLGLECLHQEGMVHRDLNPGNLMLVPGAGIGQARDTLKATVKILDIGLGRALFDEADAAGGADANLTADGAILGTPDYMAPEQARDSHTADIRSDIYSLGCTLFHALAGQLPFPDSNVVRKMVRHASEPVPPLKKFNPAAPDGLQQIVNRMMAKDPAQRYPTPERAAQALQVFLAAGAEQASREVNPKMRAFLQWLDSARDEGASAPVVRPAAAPSGSLAAPAAIVPKAPLAVPVTLPAPAPTVDVALAAVPPKKKPSLGGLSRRDTLMLLIGAGVLAAAGGAAVVLKRILARKNSQTEREGRKEE
ncbi:MAG TPA: protein kinase [Gemmataceae bacterium]|jgi:serine/threonine protein kinase